MWTKIGNPIINIFRNKALLEHMKKKTLSTIKQKMLLTTTSIQVS